MIQAQTIVIRDMAFLPRLLTTVLLIWLTGTVVVYINKLLAFSRHALTHPHHRQNSNRTRHARTAVHHMRGNWSSV